MARITRLEEDILTVLLDQDLYCKDLRDKINVESVGFKKVTTGSLYPALNALARQGYLTERWDNKGTQDRRKLYRTSASGRKVLASVHERRMRLSNGSILALSLAQT
jgi:DNA-binding PadR family transcriptional regulator